MSQPSDSPVKALRERALRLLARREHSRLELEQKLLRECDDRVAVNALLDELASSNWQSDERFAEQLVRSRAGRMGSRRIQQELKQKGVPPGLISDELAAVASGDFNAARALWQKKFGREAEDEKAQARQIRFLLSRGFDYELIRRVLRDVGDCD